MRLVLSGYFKKATSKKTSIIIALISCFICYVFLFYGIMGEGFIPGIGFLIFMILMPPIMLFQIIVLLISLKFRIPGAVQSFLYVLPCLALFIYFYSIPSEPVPLNEKSPIASQDGRFILTVPIERDKRGGLVWKVTIKDKDGKLVYKDEDSGFVGNLKVYWAWDNKDNVWLFNSDDWSVYYWKLYNGTFIKEKYNKSMSPGLKPPEQLYPY